MCVVASVVCCTGGGWPTPCWDEASWALVGALCVGRWAWLGRCCRAVCLGGRVQRLLNRRRGASAEGVPRVALFCAWIRCVAALDKVATFCKLVLGLL